VKDDEIDLSELFLTLWAYKFLIATITTAALFVSGYKALTANKEYTAKAIFQIQQSNGSTNLSLGQELTNLAALAGLRGDTISSTGTLIEIGSTREFILELNRDLAFENDPYFNTYDPNYVEPLWKSAIKALIGWQRIKHEERAIIEEYIVSNYITAVSFESTGNGILSVSVVHEDPNSAAAYANGVMAKLQQVIERKKNQETEQRLNYLSDMLAGALIDLEQAQKNLADFSMENSGSPQVSLDIDAAKLLRLRENIDVVEKFLLILPDLRVAINANTVDADTYNTIRAQHPLIDDVRFRRIMGMSEAVSEWRWPAKDTINLVEKTLTDRLKRLTVDLNELSNQAEVTAESVEEFARLTREATIAEATYTVMIEQVKAQSLVAGYKPETFKVFEYATPPLASSAPKRSLILALGLVLGIFLGCALALILGIRKSVYFTRSALASAVCATHTLRIGMLRRLSRLPLSVLRDRIGQRTHLQLEDLLLDLGEQKLILVASTHTKLQSDGLGRLIATTAAKAHKRVLLCDTSWGSFESGSQPSAPSEFATVPAIDGIDLLTAPKDIQEANVYTLKSFKDFIKNAAEGYDHVIVTGHDEYGTLAAKALKSLEPTLVYAARIGKTKKRDIAELTAITPVEVLLHD